MPIGILDSAAFVPASREYRLLAPVARDNLPLAGRCGRRSARGVCHRSHGGLARALVVWR